MTLYAKSIIPSGVSGPLGNMLQCWHVFTWLGTLLPEGILRFGDSQCTMYTVCKITCMHMFCEIKTSCCKRSPSDQFLRCSCMQSHEPSTSGMCHACCTMPLPAHQPQRIMPVTMQTAPDYARDNVQSCRTYPQAVFVLSDAVSKTAVFCLKQTKNSVYPRKNTRIYTGFV